MKASILTVLILGTLFGGLLFLSIGQAEEGADTPTPIKLSANLKATVIVMENEGGFGSGVCFHNGNHSFVWTDAHVVSECQKPQQVIDPKTGQKKVVINYDDLWIGQEVHTGGRKVGDVRRLAKIVRYSPDHDIALLKCVTKWPEKSAVFDVGIPAVATPIYHVGTFSNTNNSGSYTEGVISAVGRLRRDFLPSNIKNPHVYDQCDLSAFTGSSGGGVFDRKSGYCVGLVTEYATGTAMHAVCITPVRRLRAFAKQTNCEWALDSKVAVPEDLGSVTVDNLPAK